MLTQPVYTSKVISPEIARENEINRVVSVVMVARNTMRIATQYSDNVRDFPEKHNEMGALRVHRYLEMATADLKGAMVMLDEIYARHTTEALSI